MKSTCVARFSTNEATARRLADRLAEHFGDGETAIAAFEGAGGWTLEIHFADMPDEAAIRALVREVSGTASALAFEAVEEKDWVAESLAGLRPVAAGRFLVHGAHDRKHVAPNRIGIEIEAALAFGTGHHGTTRGCLLALDRILKRRPPRRILDIGTGTGVLAIAAARAARRRVLASDIDREAVRVACGNAELNRIRPLIEIVRAIGLADRRFQACAPFDLVLANILLGPLTRLARPMAGLLAPDACVILSGLLKPQENAALAAYRVHGLALERRIPLDEWVTLVLRRPRLRKRQRPKGSAPSSVTAAR